MDERWDTHVRPILRVLVEILLPIALCDGLYSDDLITREEYEKITTYNNAQGSQWLLVRWLLVSVLPRKGPDSFDRFLNVLKTTKGQEHIAQAIMGNTERKRKRNESSLESNEENGKLKRELKKERKEKNQLKMEVTGLRKKFSVGSNDLKCKCEISEPNIPIDCCWPFGRVAEFNEVLHVGWINRILQRKEGVWEGENHYLPGIDNIWGVFECEEKAYVMHGYGPYKEQCQTISEWKSETRELQVLTKIPNENQLDARSVIGHKENIYLVGGRSDRVDCFDIKKREWEPMKKMKNERAWCSLAVIDDKMFAGGGGNKSGPSNSVECFIMEEQKWIEIKPTTKKLCQLSSWNDKLVATGGFDHDGEGEGVHSNCVEFYDEPSGEWLPLPPMNMGRDGHGVCTTKDNKLIVVGGRGIGAWNAVECLKM